MYAWMYCVKKVKRIFFFQILNWQKMYCSSYPILDAQLLLWSHQAKIVNLRFENILCMCVRKFRFCRKRSTIVGKVRLSEKSIGVSEKSSRTIGTFKQDVTHYRERNSSTIRATLWDRVKSHTMTEQKPVLPAYWLADIHVAARYKRAKTIS